ncbi:MAG: LptF/LptG family permease [Leptospirales bacterium]|nr:LptF/LptG family permease [Leptospirales bacterium]
MRWLRSSGKAARRREGSNQGRTLWHHADSILARVGLRLTVLDRYILREILSWTGVTLIFLTAITLSIAMKDVIGDLLGKGVDPGRILLFLGNLVLEKLNFTLPFSCLFGGILAAGRLSADSEITAMRAAGVSFPRIYVNFLFCGVLSLLLLLWMGAFIGPASARSREDFQNWLKTYHSLSMVQTGRFVGGAGIETGSFDGQDIYAERRDGDRLINVQIRRWHSQMDHAIQVQVLGASIPIGKGYLTQIIQAHSGELLSRRRNDGTLEKIIRLERGFSIEQDEEQRTIQITRFENGSMDYVIPPPPEQLGRIDVRPDNFTLPELLQQIEQFDNGGYKINPLAILGALAPQVREGEGLAGLGGAGGLPPGVPESIELPSINRMEEISEQMRWQMMLPPDKMRLPPELESVPPEMRQSFALMLTTFIDDAKKTQARFAYEVQNRLAMPVACLLFFFVSFPLGLTAKRAGKGMGVVQALVIFFSYFGLSAQAATQAYSGKLSAVAAGWLPVLALLTFALYVTGRKTDGYSPLYFLTRPFRRALGWLLSPLSRQLEPDRPLGRRWLAIRRSPTALRWQNEFEVRKEQLLLWLEERYTKLRNRLGAGASA